MASLAEQSSESIGDGGDRGCMGGSLRAHLDQFPGDELHAVVFAEHAGLSQPPVLVPRPPGHRPDRALQRPTGTEGNHRTSARLRFHGYQTEVLDSWEDQGDATTI